MIKKEELPNFITEISYKWLYNYHSSSFEDITSLVLLTGGKKRMFRRFLTIISFNGEFDIFPFMIFTKVCIIA